MTDRDEIINYAMESGLAEKCIGYQTAKCRDRELVNDLLQELYLWLLTYDINKLSNAYENKHINALITRWIRNNYFSKSSPFYKTFRKFDSITDELGPKEFNIPG